MSERAYVALLIPANVQIQEYINGRSHELDGFCLDSSCYEATEVTVHAYQTIKAWSMGKDIKVFNVSITKQQVELLKKHGLLLNISPDNF